MLVGESNCLMSWPLNFGPQLSSTPSAEPPPLPSLNSNTPPRPWPYTFWYSGKRSTFSNVRVEFTVTPMPFVPLPDFADNTAEVPFFIAASTAASSSALPGQAHSPSVKNW